MHRYYRHRKSARRVFRVSHQRVAEMPDVFESIKEVAYHLGVNDGTIYRWLDISPPLPVEATLVNKNMHYRVHRAPLVAWLTQTGRYTPRNDPAE